MALNGTDFINNPWDTTFDSFTDLFGMGFYIIPITFIAIALYIKTRNPMLASSFIWASGILLTSGHIFMNYPEAAKIYLVFTIIGIVGTLLSLIFNKK